MGKSSEDELPLTDRTLPPIMLKTRARFDAILRSALKKSDALRSSSGSPSDSTHSINIQKIDHNTSISLTDHVTSSESSILSRRKIVTNARSRKHEEIGNLEALKRSQSESFGMKSPMKEPIQIVETSFSDIVTSPGKKNPVVNKNVSNRKNRLLQRSDKIEVRENGVDESQCVVQPFNNEDEILDDAISLEKLKDGNYEKHHIQGQNENHSTSNSISSKPVPKARSIYSQRNIEAAADLEPVYDDSKIDDLSSISHSNKSSSNNSKFEMNEKSNGILKDDGVEGSLSGNVTRKLKKDVRRKKDIVEIRSGRVDEEMGMEVMGRRKSNDDEIEMRVLGKKKIDEKRPSSAEVKEVEALKDVTNRRRKKKHSQREENIIGIYVHNLSWLGNQRLITSHLNRPFVRVHVVPKDSSFLPPSADTRAFHHHEGTVLPVWEELLIFEIDFSTIETSGSIILFEIFDVQQSRSRGRDDREVFCVAWAFLRPVGARDTTNTNTKVRLQLYKAPTAVGTGFLHMKHSIASNKGAAEGDGKSKDVPDSFEWWKTGKRDKFPGTIYVTVKPLEQNKLNEAAAASSKMSVETSSGVDNMTISRKWSRLPGQLCKIPNNLAAMLPSGGKGCMTVKFSNSGVSMACALADDNCYTIVVYKVPEYTKAVSLLGHQSLVYDLCWSYDDTILLSASSDRTVCVWDMADNGQFIQFLPHPSFVYGVTMSSDGSRVASCCYDHTVRLWHRCSRSNDVRSTSAISEYDLTHELEGHKGYVTAICHAHGNGGGAVYSGDSVGVVIEWHEEGGDWILKRTLCQAELQGAVVSRLALHPGGRRLLVHARDSVLRMVDIHTGVTTQWLKGGINTTVQTSACFTPCGSLVFAGGENGCLTVWNATSGVRQAYYIPPLLNSNRPITAVDYHPLDHVVVFASYGLRSKIMVVDYKHSAFSEEIGLNLLDNDVEKDKTQQEKNDKTVRITKKKDKHKNSNENGKISSPSVYRSPSLVEISSHQNSKSDMKLSSLIDKIDQMLKPSQSSNSEHNLWQFEGIEKKVPRTRKRSKKVNNSHIELQTSGSDSQSSRGLFSLNKKQVLAPISKNTKDFKSSNESCCTNSSNDNDTYRVDVPIPKLNLKRINSASSDSTYNLDKPLVLKPLNGVTTEIVGLELEKPSASSINSNEDSSSNQDLSASLPTDLTPYLVSTKVRNSRTSKTLKYSAKCIEVTAQIHTK